ncbi:hypothetical protein KS4_10490 [Poriferisphaera corsica]|uniref:Uncharacterized protein n=1 Tax=Poriferisphaera corsica TaxID=2528020 RepID=A0A517YS12_9BACT|nr:hypothetical protein [Poriferisphaera corsica]QDU33010.1 hypothetical protein KS4_10490 [Poriferisphaera corsica]
MYQSSLHLHHRIPQVIAWPILLCMLFFLTACTSPDPYANNLINPTTSNTTTLNTNLKNIRSNQNYNQLPQIFTPNPELVQIAQVSRITLPYARSLDQSWNIIDESTIPPITRAMWQNNGLRVGLIPKSELATLLDSLPGIINNYDTEIAATSYPLPVRASARIREPITLDLNTPPYTNNTKSLSKGKLQLLAQLVNNKNNKASLQLTPHHYLPKTTLEEQIEAIRRQRLYQQRYNITENANLPISLRSPLESALDGIIYDDLSLTVHIPQDQFLVVGLHWPWREQILAAQKQAQELERQRKQTRLNKTKNALKSNANQQISMQPQNHTPIEEIDLAPIDDLNDLPPDVQLPPLPQNLGRALFADPFGNFPTQIILIINITNPDTPINLPAKPTYKVLQSLPKRPTDTTNSSTTIPATSNNAARITPPTLTSQFLPTTTSDTQIEYKLNSKLPAPPSLPTNDTTEDHSPSTRDTLLPPHPQQTEH